MAERKGKTPKRPKARRAAAAAESSKQVKLKRNFQNEMSAADRIRYYLGLPQGYPMNPGLIEKASVRLRKEQAARGRLTDFEGQVMDDIHSAASAERQDERFYERFPELAGKFRSRAEGHLMRMASDESLDPMFRAQYGMEQLLGGLPSGSTALELGLSRGGPRVFPSQEAAEAHIRRSGFRDPGESVSQARARARQEAARPQNPRMGGAKRKHGGY